MVTLPFCFVLVFIWTAEDVGPYKFESDISKTIQAPVSKFLKGV